MQIPWKLKSVAFSAIETMSAPGLLYFLQKHVTKRSRLNLTAVEANWELHRENLASLDSPRLIEFGAGKNLRQNLYLSQWCANQLVVDLNPMADLEQINDAARQISAFVPGFDYRECASLSDVEREYGITYRAPYDMSETDLPDDSIDCCVSTNTLEHIPEKSIVAIFGELKRVLRIGGLISAKIDYSDHYSHTDKTIGALNFLQYEARDWERYNHGNHYQNRLRHYDFRRIFSSLGFVTEVDEPFFEGEKPPSLSSDFDASDPAVYATGGYFRLRVQD